MERAPLIVGKWKRMVRHRIGHHPAPGDLTHDSHIRDADAAQEHTSNRIADKIHRAAGNEVKNNTVLKDKEGLIRAYTVRRRRV